MEILSTDEVLRRDSYHFGAWSCISLDRSALIATVIVPSLTAIDSPVIASVATNVAEEPRNSALSETRTSCSSRARFATATSTPLVG